MAEEIVRTKRTNRKAEDRIGEKFGRALLLRITGRPVASRAIGLIRCDCGTEKEVLCAALFSGATQSCGCLGEERRRAAAVTHGLTHSQIYNTWRGMKSRCRNPNSQGYHHYGGRGIKVCERWNNSFENFLEDMGPSHIPDYEIERVDNDGDYEPGNCIWATRKIQNNNRRDNHILTYNGVSKTKSEWADELNINYGTLCFRVRAGWPIEEVLFWEFGKYHTRKDKGIKRGPLKAQI